VRRGQRKRNTGRNNRQKTRGEKIKRRKEEKEQC